MNYNGIAKREQIKSIQLHLYQPQRKSNNYNIFAFENTFFEYSFTHYSKHANISLFPIYHEDLLHDITDLPFVVINNTYVVNRRRLYSLLKSLNLQDSLKMSAFEPIFQICWEIAEVGWILDDNYDENPYWMFISPWKKYKMSQYLKERKRQVQLSTLYLCQNKQLNKQYLSKVINGLIGYIGGEEAKHQQKMQEIEGGFIEHDGQNKQPLFYQINHLIQKDYLTILCVYSMLHSLKCNNLKLFSLLIQNQILSKIYFQKGSQIVKGEFLPLNVKAGMRIFSTLNHEKNNEQDNNNNDEEKNSNMENLSAGIVKLLVGGIIAWTLKNTLYKNN